MRIALLGGIVLAALALAGSASAGCWATVGVSPPPATISPGQVWAADITVLQHGRTPLPPEVDASPTLTIVNAETGERKTFPAKAVDREASLFRAEVVFPASGRWSYEVYDSFDNWDGKAEPCATTHMFAALEVGGGGVPPSATPSSGSVAGAESGFPVWPVGGGIAGALVASAALAFLLRRRTQRHPASA
jgi:hypothetical protein